MELRDYLESSPLLQGLSQEALQALADSADEVTLAAGATLMAQGDPADDVYFLTRGRLRAFRDGLGSRGVVIDDIAPGEVVGEMAIITGRPRTATVRALRDSHLLRLPGEVFRRLEVDQPDVVIAVMRHAFERILYGPDNSHRVRQKTYSAVVVGNSEAARGLTARLAGSLETLGTTLHIDKQRCDSWPESKDPEQLERRLEVEEAQHCFLIYEARPESRIWNHQCIRHADTLLLIVDPDTSPSEDPLDRSGDIFGEEALRPRVELVFAHPPERVPTTATQWVDRHRPDATHHIRSTSDEDVARLARVISDQAQGIVFSGGGARGFAHLGVIKALKEARIPLDVAGGTSFGSLAAASVALDWEPTQMYEVFHRAFVGRESLYDFTPPIVSLTRGQRLNERVAEGFDHGNIEELSRRFYCVSSNLTTGDMKIHTRGPLWRALRASVSIPALFPPQVEDGEVLVDGGIVNNLPIDVMQGWVSKTGRVLAVDIGEGGELGHGDLDDTGAFSGWGYLGRRLSPFANAQKVPTLPMQLLRLTQIADNMYRQLTAQQADLLWRPPVEGFNVLDWSAFEELTSIGYDYACRQLEAGLPPGILT